MANPSVETVNTSGDKLMLTAGVLLVLAGFVGFFWLGRPGMVRSRRRAGCWLDRGYCGRSSLRTGQGFHRFRQRFVQRSPKVVWPTRKEATQTTLVVFAFVLVMAIFLWLSDKSIEWVIFSVILGWK